MLKDNILQLNFHTFIEPWTQFEELYGPFVNFGTHLPPKHNSPYSFLLRKHYLSLKLLIIPLKYLANPNES